MTNRARETGPVGGDLADNRVFRHPRMRAEGGAGGPTAGNGAQNPSRAGFVWSIENGGW